MFKKIFFFFCCLYPIEVMFQKRKTEEEKLSKTRHYNRFFYCKIYLYLLFLWQLKMDFLSSLCYRHNGHQSRWGWISLVGAEKAKVTKNYEGSNMSLLYPEGKSFGLYNLTSIYPLIKLNTPRAEEKNS